MIEPITGQLVRKTNPDIYKIFSGDKDDAVGPGSYEIIFPEDWKKTGTSWSKYKWEKEPKKIRPKSSYNVNSINCQIGNYRQNNKINNNETNKINTELSNYYKSYTTKQLNYKDPTAHNIDTITEFIKMFPNEGYNANSMRKAAQQGCVYRKMYRITECEALEGNTSNEKSGENGELPVKENPVGSNGSE